jgi:hypothetical protein
VTRKAREKCADAFGTHELCGGEIQLRRAHPRPFPKAFGGMDGRTFRAKGYRPDLQNLVFAFRERCRNSSAACRTVGASIDHD